ncbi:type II secretion system F family protein [Streptomyces sp. NPDC059766]|uniref:type II secretion system F family protein n=1 Tax=Streptomyces sp. NPDC059766 TaxID=3346940 RepID=UPI00364DAD49
MSAGAEVFHRLGVTLGAVLALGGPGAWAAAVRRRLRARRRIAELLARETGSAGARPQIGEAVRRRLPWVGAVAAGWVVVGGFTGVVVGVLTAAALRRWRLRQEQAQASTGRAVDVDVGEAARQLPLAAELLGACVEAGAGPVIAAQATGEALGGPVGKVLARGAAEVRLGGEPGEAWRRLASVPGAEALARLLERAGDSGLPAAGPVARFAADARAERVRDAAVRARRAAVMVTVPVGLCFLPAFIAVGVVPVVIGLAGEVMGGGGG